jgi:hypothetical protein
MPAAGWYYKGWVVYNTSPLSQQQGWLRLTTGTSHTFGIDWSALDTSAAPGLIWGLTMSNGTDATNDIDITAGFATDSGNNQTIKLASTITKQLDATWTVGTNAGGLDTGSVANDTYHVFLIMRLDTGVVDALFSVSPTAPTMPANYTLKRRIGSFYRSC